MPDGSEFTRVFTVDPANVLCRPTGTFTVWWEPDSSTVLLTRAD
jgi:hypothetical protein